MFFERCKAFMPLQPFRLKIVKSFVYFSKTQNPTFKIQPNQLILYFIIYVNGEHKQMSSKKCRMNLNEEE